MEIDDVKAFMEDDAEQKNESARNVGLSKMGLTEHITTIQEKLDFTTSKYSVALGSAGLFIYMGFSNPSDDVDGVNMNTINNQLRSLGTMLDTDALYESAEIVKQNELYMGIRVPYAQGESHEAVDYDDVSREKLKALFG